uniref:Uncharacterized protein n=1 Tax=Rhizophora mucronata TaxID=61149 RepID=A0A2P2R2H7_RHIMU
MKELSIDNHTLLLGGKGRTWTRLELNFFFYIGNIR